MKTQSEAMRNAAWQGALTIKDLAESGIEEAQRSLTALQPAEWRKRTM